MLWCSSGVKCSSVIVWAMWGYHIDPTLLAKRDLTIFICLFACVGCWLLVVVCCLLFVSCWLVGCGLSLCLSVVCWVNCVEFILLV